MQQRKLKDEEEGDRYVLILRGFLNYWLQKKYSSLGVKEDNKASILEGFMEAYDL